VGLGVGWLGGCLPGLQLDFAQGEVLVLSGPGLLPRQLGGIRALVALLRCPGHWGRGKRASWCGRFLVIGWTIVKVFNYLTLVLHMSRLCQKLWDQMIPSSLEISGWCRKFPKVQELPTDAGILFWRWSATGVCVTSVQPSCMCMVGLWAVVLSTTKILSMVPLACAEADGNLHLDWHGVSQDW